MLGRVLGAEDVNTLVGTADLAGIASVKHITLILTNCTLHVTVYVLTAVALYPILYPEEGGAAVVDAVFLASFKRQSRHVLVHVIVQDTTAGVVVEAAQHAVTVNDQRRRGRRRRHRRRRRRWRRGRGWRSSRKVIAFTRIAVARVAVAGAGAALPAQAAAVAPNTGAMAAAVAGPACAVGAPDAVARAGPLVAGSRRAVGLGAAARHLIFSRVMYGEKIISSLVLSVRLSRTLNVIITSYYATY